MENRMTWSVQIKLTILCFAAICFIFMFASSLEADKQVHYPTSTPKFEEVHSEIGQTILYPQAGCEIPCWWNIIPGETEITDVQPILERSFQNLEFNLQEYDDGTISSFVSGFESLYPSDEQSPSKNPFMSFTANTILNSDKVAYMLLLGRIFPNETTKTFATWNYFSATNLIETFGIPDSAYIMTKPSEKGLIANNLRLYWNEIGLGVFYRRCRTGLCEDIINESDQPACFNLDSLVDIVVSFENPNDSLSLEEILSSERHEGAINGSAITIEEFSEILLSNNDCLPATWDINIPAR